MLSLAPTTRVFVARGATDLRRSFDRLAAMPQAVLGQDPFSGHLFVYFNRRRDRVKLLFWERGGFWLLCKRLETGTFADVERGELDPRELPSIGLLGSDLSDLDRYSNPIAFVGRGTLPTCLTAHFRRQNWRRKRLAVPAPRTT